MSDVKGTHDGRSTLKSLGSWGLIASVMGCANQTLVPERIAAEREVTDQLQQSILDNARSRAVQVQPGLKLAGERIPIRAVAPLPPIFDTPLTYTTAGQLLDEILGDLSEQVKIPMRLTEFVDGSPSAGLPSGGGGDFLLQPMQVNWRGPLRELLDHLARTSRLYWRYDEVNQRVEFFLYETRHFTVNVPMGSRTISASIGGGNNASITTAGTSVGVQRGSAGATGSIGVGVGDLVINPYDAISRTITSMLLDETRDVNFVGDIVSEGTETGTTSRTRTGAGRRNLESTSRRSNGSRVVVSPELATVTVTAPPPTLARVTDYLASVNRQFSRNLTIDLKLFDVILRDESGLGASLDLLYEKFNRYGLRLTGAPSVAIGSSQPGQLTFEVIDPASRFNSSNLLAQALASFGEVSVVTSGQILAVNGQPAPYQVADEITYLAASETTQVGDLVPRTVTSLTPGTVVIGLTANFLPQILSDNRILLQYQLTVSALRQLNSISSGGATIQTPVIFTQALQQQAVLRDGQSVVLFGYSQDRNAFEGNASILGGSRNVNQQRSLRVIQIQVFGGGHHD